MALLSLLVLPRDDALVEVARVHLVDPGGSREEALTDGYHKSNVAILTRLSRFVQAGAWR
jgi:hypothetical protein